MRLCWLQLSHLTPSTCSEDVSKAAANLGLSSFQSAFCQCVVCFSLSSAMNWIQGADTCQRHRNTADILYACCVVSQFDKLEWCQSYTCTQQTDGASGMLHCPCDHRWAPCDICFMWASQCLSTMTLDVLFRYVEAEVFSCDLGWMFWCLDEQIVLKHGCECTCVHEQYTYIHVLLVHKTFQCYTTFCQTTLLAHQSSWTQTFGAPPYFECAFECQAIGSAPICDRSA